MKRKGWGKGFIIIAILCILIGAGMIGAGFMKGGSIQNLYISRENTSWWPFQFRSGIFYDSDEYKGNDGSYENEKTWEEALGNVKELEITMDLGDVIVKEGSKASVKFFNIQESWVKKEQSGQKQQIEVKRPSGNYQSMKEVRIEVTLPKDEYELEVTNHLGDIFVENLSFRDLDIESDLGEVSLIHVESKETTIEQKSGDIKVNGTLTGKTEIKNSLGDTDLELFGKRETYDIEVKNSLGDTQIDQNSYEGNCNIKENNGKQDALYVKNNLGDIYITFR